MTLSIFPGFLSEDVHSGLLGDWYPVLLVRTFVVHTVPDQLLEGVLELCALARVLLRSFLRASRMLQSDSVTYACRKVVCVVARPAPLAAIRLLLTAAAELKAANSL